VEPPLEKSFDAIDIPVKVVFGVCMVNRNHLGEVDENWGQDDGFEIRSSLIPGTRLFFDQDIELIEVTVYETILGEAEDHRYKFGVK
jgi:hypothetical protein